MTFRMFPLFYLVALMTSSYADKCPQPCECDHDLTFVYCYGGGLNTTHFYRIIQLLPSNVIELHIQAPEDKPNHFKWNDNLNRLTKLERISFINCNIPAISQRVRIKSLKSLNLQHNYIDSLQMDSFNGLPNLEHLDLSYNHISVVPSGSFIYLRSLKSLSLSHNYIKELPSNLFYGPQRLQQLQFDGLKISVDQLNPLLDNLPYLERLEINHCNLGDSAISGVWLHKVPKLSRLGIGGNNLTVIPSHKLRELPHLQTVDLSNNKIRKIPPCSFCSCNITTIFLGHNLLGIDENSLTIESFADVNVEKLELSFNFFDNFNSKLLWKAKHSIRSLDLSGNTLTRPRKTLIQDLPNLSSLHLASNHMEELPNTWPIEYSSLAFLNLSSNHIKVIPSTFVDSLPFLKILDISQNEIRYIDDHIIDFLTETTERVYMYRNPWDCRCAHGGVQKYLKHRKQILPFSEPVTCETPFELKGIPVRKVSKINECNLIFGGSYQLSQMSELGILLSAVIGLATLISGFMFVAMAIRRRKYRLKKPNYNHSEVRSPFPMDTITSPLKTRFKDEEIPDLPPPLQPLTTFGHV
ncbi:unnamed protein product [Bursaphelenchus xylophilus]|uniref:(pine wood nematode) hypothetical protein n=1 Tax=Bursaphelenchus xylophilus TaxID=6326 RepID=A0A1I7S7E7_BURXY|nr:unnamed protein product [Bursaphelenchus xylophilus]CAG9085003.1 unnamed protein product [Bursaphelenchus xylophilus]